MNFDYKRSKPKSAISKNRSHLDLKEQLRDRLYDKGVNIGKMPSIQKPNSEHMRPFTATMNRNSSQKAKLSQQNKHGPTLISPAISNLRTPMIQPEEDLIFSPTDAKMKSMYSIFKESAGRPTSRQGEQSKKALVTSAIIKSITGITVNLIPDKPLDCGFTCTISLWNS